MTNKTLKVICPVYNEEAVIPLFYESLKKVLVKIDDDYDWKILFVIDPSTDNTEEVLGSIAGQDKRVQLIILSRRFGHQMSLVAGIDNSTEDVVIMMDSDLQHPPDLILKMLEAYDQGYEVVYTVRNYPKDSNIIKRFGSKIFYRLMSAISEIQLASGEADYRLVSKRIVDIFKTSIRERNQFLRGLFWWIGYKRIGISYEPNERISGTSKYTFSTMLQFATHGIISFSKKPLQFAIALGIFFAFLGLIFSIYIFLEYFVNDQIPTGWTTLGILVSFFSGIQLLFLGILGLYLGAIHDEVKGRPLYLIDEKINLD